VATGVAVVRTLGNAAVAQQPLRRYEEAVRLTRRAYAAVRAYAEANPNSLTCRRNQAWIEALLSFNLIFTRREGEALPLVESARATRLAMLKDNPGDRVHLDRLMQLDQYEWVIRARSGDLVAAGAARRRALDRFAELHLANPDDPDVDDEFAGVHSELALLLRKTGQLAEARRGLLDAAVVLERLVREHPSVHNFVTKLASIQADLASIARDQGDTSEAARLARSLLALYEGLPDRGGSIWYGLARGHAVLADLGPSASPGERARALEALRHAAADPPTGLLVEFPTDPCFRGLRDDPDFRLLLMDLEMPANPFAAAPPGR
jgi:tetratricopeptide (TPR) repeat protein